MRIFLFGSLVCWLFFTNNIFAQGPPITTDKPIMLGEGQQILKTLTEIRHFEQGTVTRIPMMYHYLPTSNSLVALHIPLVIGSMNENNDGEMSLGDLNLLLKYQFYRKDGKAKTFRMVGKLLQTFPTSTNNVGVVDFGVNEWQTLIGWVAAYESIKYGISHEISYKWVGGDTFSDEIQHKLGFGLPLLKPVYPVKQINLFFEYNGNYFIENKTYELLYAQGIQYARKQWTFETAIQAPIIKIENENARKYSWFLGMRYVF